MEEERGREVGCGGGCKQGRGEEKERICDADDVADDQLVLLVLKDRCECGCDV